MNPTETLATQARVELETEMLEEDLEKVKEGGRRGGGRRRGREGGRCFLAIQLYKSITSKGLFTRCDLSCRFVGPEKS